jgi:Ca-activated chloride channel family protein
VVYAGSAGLVLPSTPGVQKQVIMDAVDRLEAGGTTAGGAGIKLAYKVALENFIEKGNNRVILATDGDFNVGVSSTSELVRMIEEKREKGIFLTTLGFGTGNYKDSRLEQLADKGNGNYHYIDNFLEGKKVFVHEMKGTLFTIAKDVKIQVEFNPAKVDSYRLLGYENRKLQKEDFEDDKKDAGELGAGHTVTALYEIIPAEPGKKRDPRSLRFQESRIKSSAFKSKEMALVKLRYKKPRGKVSRLITRPVKWKKEKIGGGSENLRFSAAVALWGMLLRKSKHCGDAAYDDVLALAKGALGKDNHGYRSEFIRLVNIAKEIK